MQNTEVTLGVLCADKPDSVEDNHVSGIAVTDNLKRLFQQQFQLKIAAGHGLAQK